MQKKNYLREIITKNAELIRLNGEISAVRARATGCTATITGMPPATGTQEGFTKFLPALLDLQRERDEIAAEIADMQREAAAAIRELAGPKERAVLWQRYVQLKSWADIIDATGWTARQTYRIHAEALKNLRL